MLSWRAAGAKADEPTPAEASDLFENRIRPVLAERCFACHSATAEDLKGGLRLDSREGVLQGGDSGPVLDLAAAETSLLVRAVRGTDPDLKMPPGNRESLAPTEVDDFIAWIKLGAPYPDGAGAEPTDREAAQRVAAGRQFWCFQPVKQPPLAAVQRTDWARGPIDLFLLARLEQQGLSPSPPADRRTLLRRATYDLTGLPPTASELEEFAADDSADAFDRAIDRLLASPAYGEHWGRHWLDVARYGDSRWVGAGEDRRLPFAYTYRDWVIRALNQDMPYDRFVTLQLAADQMSPPPPTEDLAALGFLSLGKWFTGNMHDVIDDQIDVVTRGLLGLTVQCARCHDHKYDPILTADYYSLYGLFAASQLPVEGTGLVADLPASGPTPVDSTLAESLQAQQDAIDQELSARQAAVRAEFGSPDRIAQYLLVAQRLVPQSDQEVREGLKLSDLDPEILIRWVRLLKRTTKEPQPIFGPWHAFSALADGEFPARGAELAERERAKPLNRHVAAMLSPPPGSRAELAARYAQLLLRLQQPVVAAEADDEAIRQVLRGNDSPVLIPLGELGPFFSRDETARIVARRRTLLADLARLPVAGDQYLSYRQDSAPAAAELRDFLERRRDAVVAGFRQPERIALYLLAAHEAREADELRLRSIANKQKLSERMLRRWIALLKRGAAGNASVFAAWRRFAALDDSEFAEKAPRVAADLSRRPANPLVAELFASTPASLTEVAARYAGLIARIDSDDASVAGEHAAAVRQLVVGPQSVTRIARSQADDFFSLKDRDELRGKERNLARVFLDHPGAMGRCMILRETASDYRQPIFVRGNPNLLGADAPGRWLAVLSGDDQPPLESGLGRLQLAKAIVDPANPLCARVLVNRVWQHHFGKGLVGTPSDFGVRGEAPSHPELLDWLAAQLATDGGSLKQLHRRIMLSAAYQQSSADNPAGRQVDPENRLLWRMSRRRLGFEELRDSLLAISGDLETGTGGRSQDLTKAGARRRTVYGFVDRLNLPAFFRHFDFPSPDAHVPARHETTTAHQALFLMNGALVMDRAYRLAHRSEAACENSPQGYVTVIYRLVLGRVPSPKELQLGVDFINSAPPPVVADAPAGPWQYGFGTYQESLDRVIGFEPFPHFVNNIWRGGPQEDDPLLGRCHLRAQGGQVGNDRTRSVIRRWVAPRDARLSITGTLATQAGALQPSGGGLRGWIVSSRTGQMGTWIVHGTEEQTSVAEADVRQGDTIDFVVEGRGAESSNGFNWAPVLKAQPAGGPAESAVLVWDSAKDFGDTAANRRPYGVRERFAQVLLESNELMFID